MPIHVRYTPSDDVVAHAYALFAQQVMGDDYEVGLDQFARWKAGEHPPAAERAATAGDVPAGGGLS